MISIIKISEDAFTLYCDQILAIEKASFQSPWSSRGFLEEIRNPVSYLWALKQDEQILGYICFWMFAGEAHLLNIAIHPDHRRQGLGTILLEKMKSFALAHGVEKVYLEVRPSNIAARKFYFKAGFQERGRRKRYYTDTGEDAILMIFEFTRRSDDSEHVSGPPGVSISGTDAKPGSEIPTKRVDL